MSEFVAGAFVDVKPDPKGFRKELKKVVDNAVKNSGTFKIPIELDPKRFKSTVNNAARQTSAKIPIVPSTSVTQLRREINSRIKKATDGLKIKVPIEVVRAGAGARGGGGREQERRPRRGRRTSTLREEEVATRALKKANDELAISDSHVAQAAAAGITQEERSERFRKGRAATTRSEKAANDALVVSEAKLAAEQKQALETARGEAQTRRADIDGKLKSVKATKALGDVTSQSRKLRVDNIELIRQEVRDITDLQALQDHGNQLSHVDSQLRKASTNARKQGATITAQENDKLREEIGLKQQDIKTQRQRLKGESLFARQQRTAARGGGATLLSLLGVRGATLAANNAFLIGAAAVATFAKSLQSFAKLETELNVFKETAGATAEQMKAVAAAARELGADVSLPGVSAGDAAQAMSELARAGLTVQDSIAGARGVLELAAAAQISNADAANFTASALNAFGLAGEEAVRVADLLANAANASQGSIAEFGAAMQQALAIANLVGLSLEDTVTQLTIFARNGLRGSDAGTSLRTALTRLIAPTKDAAQLLEALGINIRDAQGNIRPDIFVQFGEATKNLSPALRDMIAETIAGQDAIRAFAIGADEGSRGLKRAQLQMEATGSAARLAQARAKGLAGEFSALGSNVETLGTQFGKFAAGPVKLVVSGLNDAVTALNALLTGNFSGLFDQFEKDADNFVETQKKRLGALGRILNPFETKRPFRQFLLPTNELDEGQKKIQGILQDINALQNLRIQTFDVSNEAAIAPITEKIKALRKELRAAKIDAGLIIPVTDLEKQLFPLEQARKSAQDLKKSILERGGSPSKVQFLDDLIRQFNTRIKLIEKSARESAKNAANAIKKEVSGTDIATSFSEQFALIAKQPDLATPDVLAGLRKLASQIQGTAPLTGAAGKKLGDELIKNLNAAIKAALEDDNTELASDLQAFAARIATLFGTSLGEAFRNIKLPVTEEQILDSLLPQRLRSARAEAFGGIEAQIAAKEAELAGLKRGLGKVIKGTEDEENILNAIAAKQSEIDGLREQQAADRREASQKADKKFTTAQSAAEQKILNELTLAQATEGLKNDIRVQVKLREFYRQQIARINSTVRDAETRADQIKEAEQKLFDVEQDIIKNRAARRQQIRDAAVESIDDAAERASEDETLKNDLRVAQRRVKFWRGQVAIIKQLVKDRKATADELDEAQDALDEAEAGLRTTRRERREQISDRRRTSLELDIQFAETTENRNAEVAARRRFIAFLIEQIKSVRGNVNKVKELRNEVAAQNKAIEDLQNEAKEGDKGTTAFELLQQNAETFRATAGNLISGNQPFAGAAGFTADVAQFLFRNKLGPASSRTSPFMEEDGIFRNRAVEKQVQSNNDLIAALNALTNAVLGGTGNRSTAPTTGPGVTAAGLRGEAMADYWRRRQHLADAASARKHVEQRSGI